MKKITFWLVWRFCDLEGYFTFQCRRKWCGCGVLGVNLIDFGAMVLEFDSSFVGCFCLELGGV